MFKFTTRNLFTHYVNYLKDTKEVTSLKRSIYDAFLKKENQIFNEESKKEAYDALSNLNGLNSEEADGLFSVINAATKQLNIDADHKKEEIIAKYKGDDQDLAIKDVEEEYYYKKLAFLSHSWDLANYYAWGLAQERIEFIIDSDFNTVLTSENKEKIVKSIDELLNDSRYEEKFDTVLWYQMIIEDPYA